MDIPTFRRQTAESRRVDFEHINEFYAVREAASPGCAPANSSAMREYYSAVSWCYRPSRIPSLGMFGRCQSGANSPGRSYSARAGVWTWISKPSVRPWNVSSTRALYRPTIEVSSTPIDAAKIEGLICLLQAIPIRLAVAKSSIGLDGTRYELVIGHSFWHSRIAWWERLPDEWTAVGPVVEEMVTLCESSWDKD